MLGHIGLNVPDLTVAKTYHDALMPLLGFELFLDASDEFAFMPAHGKRGTYLFFYGTFWHDPFGFMLEAVCHYDRD
jgi:hypothetical protein